MENSEIVGEWTLLSQEEASGEGGAATSASTENAVAREEVLPEGAEDESGSNASDIAIIDEDDEDVRLASLQSSLLSHTSSFSMISASGLPRDGVEVLSEDISDQTSSIHEGFAADVDMKPSVKHYIHTRNAHLNTVLNVAVVLTITAVVGLGIGNFIGWSTQRQKHLLLSRSQVLKLKQLQDELVLCMKQQQVASEDGEESKVCYRDSDYWNQQFDALFEENHDLKGILQQVKGESQSPLQCSSDATEEFHKLKLNLIVKQMEHLEVLKNLEEIKYQNLQSKERLKILEEENTELKAKLEEEEQDDQLLVAGLEHKMEELTQENKELKDRLQEEMQDDALIAEMEKKVHQLADENKDLKRVLEDITRQVEDSTTEAPNSRATSLKQQVNDIVAENEDLKSTIARIRYGNPGEQQKRHISHLVQENEDLKQEISKLRDGPDFATLPSDEEKVDEVIALQEHIKNLQEILQQDKLAADQWKNLYQEIKLQMDSKKDGFSWSELNWVDVLKKGLQNGTEALTTVVNNIVHFVSGQNNSLKKDIFAHLNGSKIIFEAFQQNLMNKWEELKVLTKPEKVQNYVGTTKKTIQKMSEALENSMKKLHQAGLKFVAGQSTTQEGKVDKLVNKVWKIVDTLEQKWTNLKDKWTDKATKTEPQGPPQEKKTKEKNNNGQSKWYFSRARDREGMHARMRDDGKSEWVFKRAEAREQGHQTQQSRLHQDWYTRRGKSRSRNRDIKRKVNDKSDDSSCDDSSDSCDTYEFDSWKTESLLNEARNEHFDDKLFSHNINKVYPGDA